MSITVAELATSRDVRLFDIRPPDERYGSVGFVPGSIGVGESAAALQASAAEIPPGDPIALVCLSGRRSEHAAALLSQHLGREVANLTGGVLAWREAGLPVCGVAPKLEPGDPLQRTLAIAEVPRVLAACFVAEVATMTDDEIDPLSMLQSLFDRAGARWDDPDVAGLYRVLDLAGAESWRMGNELRRIATNIDRFLAVLRRLETAPAA